MDRRSVLALGASMAAAPAAPLTAAVPVARGFVTRAPDGRLLRAGKPFRYIGVNMPEVTHIRTDWDLEQGLRFRLPTRGEIDWMIEAAAQMNFPVIRTWCFPSAFQPENPVATHYFTLNPDGRTVTLNETGFRLFDYFLARCATLGVLAQVPFVYLSEKHEWPDAKGDPHAQLLDLTRKVVTRVNTITGVAYRDDPTVFCWESANEPRPRTRWVRGLAAHLKALAPRHLFMDGRDPMAQTWAAYQDDALLGDPNIDIVSAHTYQPAPNGWSYPRSVHELTRRLREGGKAFEVGEIAPITSIPDLRLLLDAIVDSGAAGGSWWSFKGARAKGGYTHWHGRNNGGGDDLIWPWSAADLPGARTERTKIELLVAAAYRQAGEVRPGRLPRPRPATLLPIVDAGHISWTPGTGEQTADIERSTRPDGGFRVIKAGYDTTLASTYAMFADEGARPGAAYWYRVTARNRDGVAPPSNVVGPVRVGSRWLVDDFWSLHRATSSAGCRIDTDYEARRWHGDLSVLMAEHDGASLTYSLPSALRSLLLIANRDTDTISVEGAGGIRLPVMRTLHPALHQEFAGYPRVTYRVAAPPAGVTAVTLRLGARDILSRLELEFA